MPARSHGMNQSPTYCTWENMINRCNPNNKQNKNARNSYGNVRVCERWRKFENFLADMGVRPEGLSLDRIDGTKGYTKENCRWADKKTQARNIKTRITNKSGQSGVSWDKSKNSWLVRFGKKHIGRFKEFRDAKAARMKAIEALGEKVFQ